MLHRQQLSKMSGNLGSLLLHPNLSDSSSPDHHPNYWVYFEEEWPLHRCKYKTYSITVVD
jgi:hypothetical protein